MLADKCGNSTSITDFHKLYIHLQGTERENAAIAHEWNET